jgi:GWxTD domain-containing protein
MNWLDTVVQMGASQALGWTVLYSLWQGVLLPAMLGVVLASTRSPRIRYATACFALVALGACFGLTLLYLMPPEHSRPQVHSALLLPRFKGVPGFHGGNYNLESLVPWLAPAWLVGVWVFYIRYAVAWFSTNRLRHRAACHAPACWQTTLARLANEAKVSRPVVLLESLFADSPMVLGHLRPVILTPLGFITSMPPDQVEAVLFHELAHIARCDYLTNMCQRLLAGLLFYHPAVWWIARVIRQEREHCCDDLVVAWRGDAHAYAVALTELETYRHRNWPAQEAALAARGGNLMKRITRLLYPKGPSSVWAPLLAIAMLAASAGLVVAAYRAAPQATTTNNEGVWRKWINQDVAYIISDKEKAAFEHLTTDAERRYFVEQFWERRNPTPGAVDNPFKTEHYRRLAFANQHSASTIPGYQTDRGHIYIVYGPPDEIEADPQIGNRSAIEVWRYRPNSANEDGSFTFVARDGTNDYRLAPTQ